ncbi:MAG: putative small integral membrane protein [Rheinheimera aquimaris]|jgi:predicted small integral membrane protein|uniref:hypothetical protein n=1 Tax=Rheinheimera aquimaris TaxID=412437 RepID=UPI0039E327B4
MSRKTKSRLQPDWWSKTTAIVLLCYPLALCGAGLLELALPAGNSRDQLIMWTVASLTLPLLALSFLFHSGRKAWIVLGAANLFGWGTLVLIHYVSAGGV